jgi:hypothetical protein
MATGGGYGVRIAAIVTALALPATPRAAPMCVDIDPGPMKSGCGSISAPGTVRAGESFSVSVDFGCSGASVSASHTLPEVVVDGVPMTVGLGVADMYNYDPPSPVPRSGAIVTNLPSGSHTIQFTVDPDAATSCVLGSGLGPWVVLGAGFWSTVKPFDVQGSSQGDLEATIVAAPAVVGVGDSFDVTLGVTNVGKTTVSGVSTSVAPWGAGKVEKTDDPVPDTVDLAPGATHAFLYKFDATMKGEVVMKGRAEGAAPDASLVTAPATCDPGGGGACPADRGGALVTIADCTISDVSGPIAVARLTGDRSEAPSAGYAPGVT